VGGATEGPILRAAFKIVVPLGTSMVMPSIVILNNSGFCSSAIFLIF
jgi:hypothetical protein